jgi:hypothetical protein
MGFWSAFADPSSYISGIQVQDPALLTMDSVQRTPLVIGIQIAHCLAHHQAQFDFIVQANALGAQDGSRAWSEDRGGGLEEEERLLGGCIVQLGDVIAKLNHVVSNCGRKRETTSIAALGTLRARGDKGTYA